MNEWMRTWSPLSLGGLLMVGAYISLQQDQAEGAGLLAGVSCLLIGSWLTTLLHDRFSSKDEPHREDD